MRQLKLIIAALFLISPFAASADLINGSFEHGFAGWNVAGLTGVVGEVGPHAPTDGMLQAALESNWFLQGGGVSDDEISDMLGLPRVTVPRPYFSGGFPPTITTNLFELLRQDSSPSDEPLRQCFSSEDNCFTDGAVVYQSFEAEAGQRIKFDWNLLGFDPATPDSFFLTLTGPGFQTVVLLSDTGGPAESIFRLERSNILPIDPAFGDVLLLCVAEFVDGISCDGPLQIEDGATGYQSSSLDILGSGNVTLGFTLLNSSGPSGEAGLLVDNVRVVDIPEPGTLALLGIGLFGMGLARRRRKI